jgi:hypothetical protein
MIFLIRVRPGFVSTGCHAHLIARSWHTNGAATQRRGPSRSNVRRCASPDRAAGNSGNVRLSLPGRELVFGNRWRVGVPGEPGDVDSRTYDNPERREDG